MLNHDFKKVQSTLARKVFDVPGNRVTLENDGFAIDMRKRAARSSTKLTVDIIFHTADRLAPYATKVHDNHQFAYCGNWLNFLVGYKIPELSKLIFANFADARVLLGQYRKDEDGLIHFYVFRNTGEPYFREECSNEYQLGIYIVERRIGNKKEQDGFNSRYAPLSEVADYVKLSLPTEKFEMQVFNAFMIPMHCCLTDYAHERSEQTIIKEYQRIYREFLCQKSATTTEAHAQGAPTRNYRPHHFSAHLFFNAKAYTRGFVITSQGDIVEPTRIVQRLDAPEALIAEEQYWDKISSGDIMVEVSVIDSDSPHYTLLGRTIAINEEQLDALVEIKRIVGAELAQATVIMAENNVKD